MEMPPAARDICAGIDPDAGDAIATLDFEQAARQVGFSPFWHRPEPVMTEGWDL